MRSNMGNRRRRPLTDDELSSTERWGAWGVDFAKGEKTVKDRLEGAMAQAEADALYALSYYNFRAFGHQAEVWSILNHVGGFDKRNPFRFLVVAALECGPLRRGGTGARRSRTCPLHWRRGYGLTAPAGLGPQAWSRQQGRGAASHALRHTSAHHTHDVEE